MGRLTRATWTGLLSAALASSVLAGCGGDDEGGDGGDTLTMWTLEDVQARITKTENIAAAYAEESGIDIKVVAISEDQYPSQLSNAAASGELPDVIAALGLSGVGDLGRNELLDPDMAQEVVDNLGADTFSERALQLTQDTEGTQLAVPSDGWAQLLFYRKDLFEQAGLEPPTTYDAIEAAAAELDSSEVAGITAATAPGDSFTQQTFEHLAMADGCQLVDDEGAVTIDSDECTDAMTWYTDLMAAYSPSGKQDVDTTRATYFAGKAAMVVWSSFLLDELAGLRDDALPTCPECRDDPSFLVDNTGIVSSLEGPLGSEPAQYGEITSWAIPDGASSETADFVEYMMSDAYVDWLSLAPEGKVPVRSGTEDNPTEYVDAWPSLKAGEDRKAPLNSIFDQETLDTILSSPDTFQRWGFEQGEGALAGAMLAELPVPEAIAAVLAGDLTPEEAVAQAQEDVQRIAETVQ